MVRPPKRNDAMRSPPAEPAHNRLGEGRHSRTVTLGLVALLERAGDRRQHARSRFRMPAAIPFALSVVSLIAGAVAAAALDQDGQPDRDLEQHEQRHHLDVVVTGSTPGSATASAATTT